MHVILTYQTAYLSTCLTFFIACIFFVISKLKVDKMCLLGLFCYLIQKQKVSKKTRFLNGVQRGTIAIYFQFPVGCTRYVCVHEVPC